MANNGHTSVTVAVIPNCDVNAEHGPAFADAKVLEPNPGPWGNFCLACFIKFGCALGLGRGQEFILEKSK